MAKAIREVYGETLAELGGLDERIVVLDSDVSGSTKSGIFAAKYPERFYNVGIAELNMVGMAAGLAAGGKIPFANTFAVFLTSMGLIAARAFGSYSGLNIKLMGAYGGLSDAYDGASHHSLEDVAIMSALPGFEVYVASDEHQTRWLVKNAVNRDKPMYIRLSRDSMPTVYTESTKFEPGKGKLLREGADLTIIACGIMVGYAIEAAQQLSKLGISAEVIDLFCIKPIDSKLVTESVSKTHAVVTAEEHSVMGGLGSAVAGVLTMEGVPCVQRFVGMQDCHGESGEYKALLAKYGLDTEAIVKASLSAIEAKK